MDKEWEDGEFEQRVAEVLADEVSEPLQWWYLSFAEDERGFLGGLIIEAHGLVDARTRMPLMGIASPGGQVAAWPLPDEFLPHEKYRNRLLSKEEIVEFWPDAKTIREHEASR